MNKDLKILNEENPFLREIWANGYEKAEHDQLTQEVRLYKKNEMVKVLYPVDFINISIKTYPNLRTGKNHSWISETDGSADRFRELLQ